MKKYLGLLIIAVLIALNLKVSESKGKINTSLVDLKANACESMEGISGGEIILLMQDCGWPVFRNYQWVWLRGCMDADRGRCENYDI